MICRYVLSLHRAATICSCASVADTGDGSSFKLINTHIPMKAGLATLKTKNKKIYSQSTRGTFEQIFFEGFLNLVIHVNSAHLIPLIRVRLKSLPNGCALGAFQFYIKPCKGSRNKKKKKKKKWVAYEYQSIDGWGIDLLLPSPLCMFQSITPCLSVGSLQSKNSALYRSYQRGNDSDPTWKRKRKRIKNTLTHWHKLSLCV